MANFKLKLKTPERILTFDDSDLSECQQSSKDSSSPQSSAAARKNEVVLPRSVPNHLLLTSILEQLCIMYSNNKKQAQDIFKSMCEQLAKLNVVSPLLMMDEMSSLRNQYRHCVHKMLIAAIHKNNKGSLLALISPSMLGNGPFPVLPNSLPAQPSGSPDDLINQTSRYESEFVEIVKIGRGGFGAVFKCKNKLDGKLYAIKKVKLKHSKPEVWYRVLREVKALASLQHQNIVGYNSAWLEYGLLTTPPTKAAHKVPSQPDFSVNKCRDCTDDASIIFYDSREPESVNGVVGFQHPGPSIKELNEEGEPASSSPPKPLQIHRHNSFHGVATHRDRENVFFSEFQPQISSGNTGVPVLPDDICVKNSSKKIVNGKNNLLVHDTFQKRGVKNDDSLLAQNSKRIVVNTDDSLLDSISMSDPSVIFAIDDDDDSESDEEDENANNSRHKAGYARSISCDPLASGEATLLSNKCTVPAKFQQAEFPLPRSVTLYIQMELCGPTLKDWMQSRNEMCKTNEDFVAYTATNMIIFRQILKAVDYIHNKGLIHRDLKPRNIFLRDDSCHVKVGDFGLATDDIFSSSPIDSSEPYFSNQVPAMNGGIVRTASILSDHTSGVGTSTYAAPEQLDSCVYNTKSDIYSLGVILFELFQKYSTEMERYRSLGDLRKGLIPEHTCRYWPVQVKYMHLMTNENPEIRPSVRDLLSGELFLSKDQVIESMKAREIQYLKEIESLKQLVKEKDKIINKQDEKIDVLIQEMKSSVMFNGTSV